MSIARRLLPAVATLLAVPTIASAQLVGSTMGLQYLWPNTSSVVEAHGPSVVGAGVEFNNVLGIFNVDVANNSVTANYYTASSWCGPLNPLCPQPGTTFNGFRLFDVGNTAPAITSVTLNGATNMVGLTNANISFDADNIYVDWKNLAFDEHTVVALDVNSQATTTPEPATIALMGLGLAGVGVVARRRRAATA